MCVCVCVCVCVWWGVKSLIFIVYLIILPNAKI